MWSELHIDQVFRVDIRDLTSRTVRWGGRLLSGGKKTGLTPAKSLVDTQPLREMLYRVLAASADGRLEGIHRNLRSGWLQSIALTASSYTTGQSITWVQTGEACAIPLWERPQRKSLPCEFTVEHVLATSSLPFLFPAIEIDGAWFGDGGIRLTAPLSPAVHLGATHILAVSTRYARTREEADRPLVSGYPPPAQVAGVLYNAIFLDQLDSDALHLQQINSYIARLPPEKQLGRHIELLVIRPSEDLGKLANQDEAQLPRAFRFLTRGMGTRETRSNDMLSLVMFQSDYVNRLIEMGEQDAARRAAEIQQFVAASNGRS